MPRRSLAHGKDIPAEKWGWKPFGFADYGYQKFYQTGSSFTIWALVTLGSISVNPVHAILVLVGALVINEFSIQRHDGTGASWVHNVQAGYCWYHHFIKGKTQLPLVLGSWAEIIGDLGAIVEEMYQKKGIMYNHKVHMTGAIEGFITAMLLDRFNFSAKPTLWKAIPFFVIGALAFRSRR
jgi:hypothetical protein